MELLRYVSILRRRLWLLIVCTVIGGTGALLATQETTLYSAKTTLYIGNQQLAQSGQQINAPPDETIKRVANTFSYMIDSAPIAQEAIENTGVPRTAGQLVASATPAYVQGTSLMTITVVDPDPAIAQKLTNALADVFVTAVRKFEPDQPTAEGVTPSFPAYVFERARVPSQPLPSKARGNMITGAVFGLVAAAALAFVLEYVDLTIKTPSDVEEALELPVLGVIPVGSVGVA